MKSTKRKSYVMGFFLLLSLAIPIVGVAETKVLKQERMAFGHCLRVIKSATEQFGFLPTKIVETPILRIVRFPKPDESGEAIMITCSKPDKILLISLTSPR